MPPPIVNVELESKNSMENLRLGLVENNVKDVVNKALLHLVVKKRRKHSNNSSSKSKNKDESSKFSDSVADRSGNSTLKRKNRIVGSKKTPMFTNNEEEKHSSKAQVDSTIKAKESSNFFLFGQSLINKNENIE